MINNVGVIPNVIAPTASAATNVQQEWISANETTTAATDVYTAGAPRPRVGQSEYDTLFENLERNFSGHAEKSTGNIFSSQRVDVKRDYTEGVLERESAWVYNNSWLGLVQKLDQSIMSRQTPDGIEKAITYYGDNEKPECQTVFINNELYSTTHYGAQAENEDIISYANGDLDVRTNDADGKTLKIEKYGPADSDGQRRALSVFEFENGHLAKSRINYDDGGYSLSEFSDNVERTKEEVFRADGTLKSSFVRHEDGKTKYKEFGTDGVTVTYEYPFPSNGK